MEHGATAVRFQLNSGIIILTPETETEGDLLIELQDRAQGHVFHLQANGSKGCALHGLGHRDEACREPINILFDAGEQWQPISNLAFAPFVLGGRSYASVEGFWQGLKFSDTTQRARIARLHGRQAKKAGENAPSARTIDYEGVTVPIGGREHWALMEEACWAKFKQNATARDTLLSTGQRPLMHRPRRDSKTIPGVIMADIWMRIRERLSADAAAAH
jgi:predicted NAD-dependent protein-ADP-ribosyltransferase YbiA (DUF1768 family)